MGGRDSEDKGAAEGDESADDKNVEGDVVIRKEHYDEAPLADPNGNTRIPKSLRSPIRPPASEVEKHELTHLPYRNWCRVCVEAKGKEDAHPRGKQDKDDKSGLPIVSFDYQEMNELLQLRLLVGKDETTGMVMAHQAVCKGPKDVWLMRKVVNDLRDMGRADIIMKTDGEPAIVAVQDEVQSRRPGRTVPRNPAAYNPESNGACEKAVQDVTSHVRALKIALEYKIKEKLTEADAIVQWMIEHATFLINRFSVGQDGMAPYERLTGRKWNRPLVEMGELVLAKMALRRRQQGRVKKQKHKLAHRSVAAIWVGQIARTGEHIVVKKDGKAVRCRTVRRVPMEQRWSAERVKAIEATPRHPAPNSKDPEAIEARIAAEEEHGDASAELKIDPEAKQREDQGFAHRELRITESVLDTYGYTPNCPGCMAKLGGPTTNRGHTAECRQRIYDAMEKEDSGRAKLEAVRNRMRKQIGKDEAASAEVQDKSSPAEQPADERSREEEENTPRASRNPKRKLAADIEPNANEPTTLDPMDAAGRDGDAAMGGTRMKTRTSAASMS